MIRETLQTKVFLACQESFIFGGIITVGIGHEAWTDFFHRAPEPLGGVPNVDDIIIFGRKPDTFSSQPVTDDGFHIGGEGRSLSRKGT